MDISPLINLCRNKKVWIQTHNFPDPDAIGSSFALQELLRNFGIYSKICYEGAIDKLSTSKMISELDIEIHSHNEIADILNEDDVVILVDCQKNSGNTLDITGDEKAAIDHHPTIVKTDYIYSDIRITGACASIIAEYFLNAGITPSAKAATALIYAIRMDTLQLSRGVTEFDIAMYSFLFPFVDNRIMHILEKNNMEFSDLQAYGVAINNTKIYGKVGFSYIDFECPDALVAILSDFLLSLVEVEVAVIYAQRKTGYKFSIRSERADADAGKIANAVLSEWGNGGGHSFMAGGFVPYENIPVPINLFYHTIRTRFIDAMKELCPDVL